MADTLPSSAFAISEGTLNAAVESGLLSMEQASGLRELESRRITAGMSYPRDEEQFRFIGGFSDIFVAIGLGLFLGALSYFAWAFAGPGWMGAIVSVASWLLAEYFTRKRRMALPSIFLLLVFAAAILLAFGNALAALNLGPQPTFGMNSGGLPVVGAAMATVIFTAIHYWRFRVPITVAAGVASLILAIAKTLQVISPELFSTYLPSILLVCGVLTFALAMRFDLSDPKRATRRTDIAFWLHMLAAPLIVHPLVNLVEDTSGRVTTASAWSILAIFTGLSIVAVFVDRRAILVSGLIYAGIAFGTLVGVAGLRDSAAPLAILTLGALVLLLSAGWHSLRRTLLSLLPPSIAARLPAIA